MASHYRISLADVSTLRLWEMNHLIEEMEEASQASNRPKGSTPVMT